MKVGVVVPQGWHSEYHGVDDRGRLGAHRRGGAARPSALGFESIWLYDHFHTLPDPPDEIVFESFTSLSALAALTRAASASATSSSARRFRNPALTAKMISTLDTISGGRADLGIGAGWKREEWLAFGYPFPPTRERLAVLPTISRSSRGCSSPGTRTAPGTAARTRRSRARSIGPSRIQKPRVPIMVGGNGPNVTWRLAAKHADELNLDGMPPPEVEEALPVIASRCEEIGRDPASLADLRPHVADHAGRRVAGSARVPTCSAHTASSGCAASRSISTTSLATTRPLESLADDAVASGASMEPRAS